MPSETIPPRRFPMELTTSPVADGSYVDWPAILAGAVLALAISFLLISFGASLGLSLTSPYRGEGVSPAWLSIAGGIWFAWVMVTGFGAGGYFAGRMRRHAGDAGPDEVEARDGAHGLMVWATGALVSTVIAATGAGGFLGAGASTVSTATDLSTEAASSEYFANLLLRHDVDDPEAEVATGDMAQSTEGASAAIPSRGQSAQDSAQILSADPTVRQEISSIIARSAASGEMAERDRSYLAQLVAANSVLDEAGARARVDEVNAEIDEARATTMTAIEKARVAGVVLGFTAAATLLIGAVAAFVAAAAGGRHRDAGLGLDVLTARR